MPSFFFFIYATFKETIPKRLQLKEMVSPVSVGKGGTIAAVPGGGVEKETGRGDRRTGHGRPARGPGGRRVFFGGTLRGASPANAAA